MKQKVQLFGRFLSGMVMPNIAAFIAWGLITALFIDTGWLPNEQLSALVGPMSKYLLPLLIAYTGGKMVGGQRGGVIGAIATVGVIVGSENPMFLGAMIMGPFAGWVIKHFDKMIEGKVKAGFEMLVNNFSLGIIGGILTCIALVGVTPLVNGMTNGLAAGVNFFVERGILPLASIIVEPAKVLFLNNAINHGIFTPLGMQQAEETGKSILYLLESNPGPGLGILLAYCLAGKGAAKSSAPGAVIIHFFGGIHEIYFPYILMNPLLLISAIAGGAGGVFTLQLLDGGLMGPASPGSIIAILGMTEKNSYVAVILGVLVAAVISFLISMPILKFAGKDEDLEAAQKQIAENKAKSKGLTTAAPVKETVAATDKIRKIVFACDAGMGSSAMGATVLRKKLAAAGMGDIEVVHAPVSSIPADAQIVVTHHELGARAEASNPKARIVTIQNFLGAPEYDTLVEDLKNAR